MTISSVRGWRQFRAFGWFVVGIFGTVLTFEVAVHVFFRVPNGAREPSDAFQRFFDYGLSIFGKLDRTVGKPGKEPTAIVRAGWLPTELYPPSQEWVSSNCRVLLYGMSFTNRIAREMEELDPTIAVRTRAGPGASFNHSYALAEIDPWRDQATLVAIGILSSSLPELKSITSLGCSPENPAPYTYPMFELKDGEIARVDPVISNRDEFIAAYRAQDELWNQFVNQITKYDAYWDPFVFQKSPIDYSALGRLLLRARASHNIDRVRASVYDPQKGYQMDDAYLAAVPELLGRLHATCVVERKEFLVILLHARGEPGHLDQWLRSFLEVDGILVVSTTDIFSSADVLNFENDGHYIPGRDRQIAEAVLIKLKSRE